MGGGINEQSDEGKADKSDIAFCGTALYWAITPAWISLIDTRIIGGILGENALAAVGATISLSDMLIEFLNGIICILRNSMQGFGDTKTPLVSSLIELAGKVLIAYLLAPVIGYMGVIISEPVVWAFMVIPLLVGILRSPIWKAVTSSDA